ncbi:unnamed protein product [Brassicogethes aeneus]|uniref:Guanylate cyclase domain-containing protein n=1 Tax=Brassicogethes aeneus TaxID=1431903 RepID=A0A9P0B3N9_BRAAE|nr:unnamed protein product [Brassicogethes aeneus]
MANFDKEIVGIQNIAEMKSKLLLIARGLDRDGTFLKSEYSDLDVLEDPETKIIASFLPDEIIYNVDDYSHRSFDCAILAGDVSGFTDLTEKYSKMDGGASKVTEVLNSYIGNMVQEIMSHGGDILNFSGDAFIAIYKKSENFTKRDAVREAIDCGLIIQKRYGNYPTDIGINIKVKLLISAGILHFSILGDKKNAQYLSIGQPIWDLKEGDGKCGPGDVVVCQSAWRIINSNDYNYTEFDDNMYIQVHGIGQNWRMVQRSRYSVFTKEESFEKFSGNTYCGVFGHALRKEYTVIGKIVNKAARIMMAYNNSISCERGTFLLSKLKPAYFTLREYKPLKGIASPGPIYAFKIVKTRDEEYINLKDPSHPILGREKETALYLHLLDVAKQEFRSENVITNVLITQGPPLIGQKRLTQEFIYVTPKDIPINKIRLSNLNVDLYEPIRKIFLPAMGLTDVSSKHKIEEEIRTRLNSSENEKKLWILNPVFNVNFMRYHMELKFTERVQALREILMKLAYSTFATLWVVMIRKINYIREDIWKLINELSKKNLIFITCEKTVNETKNLQYTYEENVQVLTLPPLDKVLLCFFICQYLNVRGISVELKR